MSARATGWRRRGDMALRIVAAVPLGYGVASLWAMALARLLPGDRAEATVAATLLAFVICAGAAMYAFDARSGMRALAILLVLGAVAAGIVWSSIATTGAAMNPPGFRQSQATLHTWSGLLLGWVLFLVFVTGTIAFWRDGLNRWMRPELARVEQPMRVLAGAQRFLEGKAPGAKTWFIQMPSAATPGAHLFWVPQPKKGEAPRGRRGRRDNQALIGADGTPVVARETRGGEFFYRFHFDLHYMPVIWARWLVGVAAMMMLVAILTGIVTHKKIFRDFFTLRRHKGQRSWLDGHNASAVLALPFHLMITYTGIVTLMALLMPWAAVANYADQAKLTDTLFPHVEAAERTGRPAPLVHLTRIVADAERRFGGPAGFVSVSEPGDAAAQVSVSRAPSSMLNTRTPGITYDGATGRPIWQSPLPGPAAATAGAMIGLHAGRFADDVLRWIYFLCGVAGCLMVASGLVMWTVKRREKLPDPARPHLGFRAVETLNIAVIGGFPLGIACLFWANRLLPVAMEGRAEWEIHTLFLAWLAALLLTALRRPREAWTLLLGSTGVLLAGLPLYNLVATPARHRRRDRRQRLAAGRGGPHPARVCRRLSGSRAPRRHPSAVAIDGACPARRHPRTGAGRMTLTALLLALAAFALFGLSTDAHHRRWFGGRVTSVGRRLFRIGAWVALPLAFAAAIGARGWVFGPVLWFALVMLAAGATFLFLNCAPARFER